MEKTLYDVIALVSEQQKALRTSIEAIVADITRLREASESQSVLVQRIGFIEREENACKARIERQILANESKWDMVQGKIYQLEQGLMAMIRNVETSITKSLGEFCRDHTVTQNSDREKTWAAITDLRNAIASEGKDNSRSNGTLTVLIALILMMAGWLASHIIMSK